MTLPTDTDTVIGQGRTLVGIVSSNYLGERSSASSVSALGMARKAKP